MSQTRIPLFPLDIVLFPGQSLPLHIFEPRYRLMTQRCVETRSPFGLVLADSSGIQQVGCSALITKVLKVYPDGRSDILVLGQKAVRIIHTYDEEPYFEADVEYLDEDYEGIEDDISKRLDELFDQCHRFLYQQGTQELEREDGLSLAYFVASELPLDTRFRQVLLSLRSEAERQRKLLDRLTEWLPQLERRGHLREKASGNGHTKI
jgi:ATP-dependent Lon protease